MNVKKYTTARMAGEFIGIFGRTFKLFLFNVLMFCLGFGACYVYAVQRINMTSPYVEASDFSDGYSIESGIKRLKAKIVTDFIMSNNTACVTQWETK